MSTQLPVVRTEAAGMPWPLSMQPWRTNAANDEDGFAILYGLPIPLTRGRWRSLGYVATWAGGFERVIVGVMASGERLHEAAPPIVVAIELGQGELGGGEAGPRSVFPAVSTVGGLHGRFAQLCSRISQLDGRPHGVADIVTNPTL